MHDKTIQHPYPMVDPLVEGWKVDLKIVKNSESKVPTKSVILDELKWKEAQRKLSRAGRHASESVIRNASIFTMMGTSVSDENQTDAPSEISQRAQRPTPRNMNEPDADVKGESSSQQQNGPISEYSGNSSHDSGRVTQDHPQSDVNGVKNFLIEFRNGNRNSEALKGDDVFMEISNMTQAPNAADQSWTVENSNATPSGVPSSGSENNTDYPSKTE